MKILRLTLISFICSATALFLSDQVLYRLWLAPRLASFEYIPSYEFYIAFFPIVLVVLVFGLMLSSLKQVCLAAFIFAFSYQIHDFMRTASESPGYILNFTLEHPYNVWIIRAFLVFCIYAAVFGIVWYIKVIIQKTFIRYDSKHLLNKDQGVAQADIKENKIEDLMLTRITYHVVPDSSGWLVKKGRAKKASSAHATKEEALHAASDLAKSHPLSQVVVHKASGIIASDRTYGYRHYKQKKRKKEVIKKIKKGLKRNKRKENEQRLRRRKAAQLGIARLKRKQYLRRAAAKKAARKRKK